MIKQWIKLVQPKHLRKLKKIQIPKQTKEQREEFYKQCALLLNMDKLQFKYNRSGVMHEKSNDAGFTSYNGRIHMVTDNGESNGQKNTILNKLVTLIQLRWQGLLKCVLRLQRGSSHILVFPSLAGRRKIKRNRI